MRVKLKETYFNGRHSKLGYNKDRRTMYSDVDVNESGKVCGVYSGFCQQMKDTIFLNPINAEHTIPQSWFSKKEPVRSDLHSTLKLPSISMSPNNLFDWMRDNNSMLEDRRMKMLGKELVICYDSEFSIMDCPS